MLHRIDERKHIFPCLRIFRSIIHIVHLHRVFRLVVKFPAVDVVVEVYEFEVFSAYAVVTFHRVFGGVFIIVVIYRLAPVRRGCTVVLYDRTK